MLPPGTHPPDPEVAAPPGSERRTANRWLVYTGLGLEMGGSVLGLMGLGWWLDRRWATTPWLMLAGALLGLAGVGALLFKVARNL